MRREKTPPAFRALYRKTKIREAPRVGETPHAPLLRPPAAFSAEAVMRLGLRGSGLIWSLAGRISARCAGRVSQDRLWGRALAAIVVSHAGDSDERVLELARGLMLAFARDPEAECDEARAIESKSNELMRASRAGGC